MASAVTVICFVICARSAFFIGGQNSRLFAMFSLFSMSWAVLVPYYSTISHVGSELLPAFNGYLVAFVGVILLWESHRRDSELTQSPATIKVMSLDKFALSLLWFIILPDTLAIFSIKMPPNAHADAWIGTILTLVGLIYLGSGLHKYVHSGKEPLRFYWSLAVAVLLAIYAAGELSFQLYNWWSNKWDEPMHAAFTWFFAAMKLLTTIGTTASIIWSNVPQATRSWDEAGDVLFRFLNPLSHATKPGAVG
jgi:hypothetical protein